jgi:hypothetical protein
MIPPPLVEGHGKWLIVRDDLIPGGTKRRVMNVVAQAGRPLVYAGPAWGGAALAMALEAEQRGLRCTLFYAGRKVLAPRQRVAADHGANIVQITPGYLSVVRARARAHCDATGDLLVEWGGGSVAHPILVAAARTVRDAHPDVTEVWCATGSGTLARALVGAFPGIPIFAVAVGHEVAEAGVTVYRHPLAFEQRTSFRPPFPSCAHYDAKAWEIASRKARTAHPLFWNVAEDVT